MKRNKELRQHIDEIELYYKKAQAIVPKCAAFKTASNDQTNSGKKQKLILNIF